MTTDLQDLVTRLMGGDEQSFLTDTWRRRTRLVQDCVRELCGGYSYPDFLADYRALDFHEASLLISVDEQKQRRMSRPTSTAQVEEALERGMSVAVQALLLPSTLERLPVRWRSWIALHKAICQQLLPDFPHEVRSGGAVAALDLFCTKSETSIGGHYDTGDVFYLVFDGEKEWTVELAPDAATGHALAAEGTNYRRDRPPLHEHARLVVRPGDCLYVPPYTYHRVLSAGPSVAASFGLPAHTEVTLLAALLSELQQREQLFAPLPCFPGSAPRLRDEARAETRVRLQRALALLTAATRLD